MTAGIALPLFTFGVQTVFAENTSEPVTTTTSSSDTGSSTTSDTKDATELKARLQERVTEMKTKLTTAQQARVKNRCSNAQGVIKSVGTKVDGAQAAHTKVYSNVVSRLTALQEKLSTQGVDVTTLGEEIATLSSKITVYTTDLAAYKQAVADLSSMGCASDPTSFQASLDAARKELNTVRADSISIHEYITTTIKPTLTAIRTQLEATEGSN